MVENQSQSPFNLPPPTSEDVAEWRADALRRAVSHLLPHLHGAFMVGTWVSASDNPWCSYQLTDNDADCLMLASMLPSITCRWAREILLGRLSTDMVTTSNTRGDPKEPYDLSRALRASLAEINEFFERWLLVGHFVTEFDCLEPVIYAHRPEGVDVADYLRSTIFVLNHTCNSYLEKFGLQSTKTIMERAHEHVSDFMELYPAPEPADAASLLRRLLTKGVQFDPVRALPKMQWIPGFGEPLKDDEFDDESSESDA
jgi:hypothetical protein